MTDTKTQDAKGPHEMSLTHLKGAREFIERVGLPVALVLFFVWQGSIRETRLNARIDALESYQRESMEMTIRDSTNAMREVTAVVRDVSNLMHRMERHLDDQRVGLGR